MMASFEQAFSRISPHEYTSDNYYSNDPDDKGKETYMSISRKHHPKFKGWAIIDAARENGEPIPFMELLVMKYWKDNFWNVFDGDQHPQIISDEMLDISINMSPSAAIKMLQKTLNILNYDSKDWKKGSRFLFADLVVDGLYGGKTASGLKEIINLKGVEVIHKHLNTKQAAYYDEIALRDPTQRKWIGGWYSRVQLSGLLSG